MSGKLIITIPVWDTITQHRFTCRAVAELVLKTEHSDMVVVFVDNASPYSETRAMLLREEKNYPDKMHVICNEENNGYGGGGNQGLKWGYENDGEYFIVCNNDISFLSSHWYEPLIQALDKEPRSLAGLRFIPNNMWVYFPDTPGGENVHHPYLEGFMLAFRRCFLDDVGYIDEIFNPAWVEDVELSWRAQKNGYGLVLVPGVKVFHTYGQTGYDGRLPFNAMCAERVERFQAKVHAGLTGRVGWKGE